MGNNSFRTAGKEILPKYGRFIQHGYNDYLSHRPFPDEYDTWDKVAQSNYECGRLHACNIKAAGLTPPKWRKNVALPRDFMKLACHAIDLVGAAHRTDIRRADHAE